MFLRSHTHTHFIEGHTDLLIVTTERREAENSENAQDKAAEQGAGEEEKGRRAPGRRKGRNEGVRGERGDFFKSEVVFLAAIGCFLKPHC